MARSPLPTPAAVVGASSRAINGAVGGRRKGIHHVVTALAIGAVLATVAMLNGVLRREESETGEGARAAAKASENYTFPYCACAARVGPEIGGRVPSSCSDYATSRGPGQRVVTYSYYGDSADPTINRRYLSQIRERAADVARRYPGWTMRVYYDGAEDDLDAVSEMCDIWCAADHVDFCDVNALPRPFGNLKSLMPVGRTWRFVVMLDPLVDVFISRDLDSSILDREVSAVGEWLESDRTFHIIRDHPSHNGYMMAGLWGAKNSANRMRTADLGNALFNEEPRRYWDFDQALLRRVVWPEARKDALQHDSYSCGYKAFTEHHRPRAFPTRREGTVYVGWGPARGPPDATGLKECPPSCRPAGHKDWTLC